LPLLAQAAQSQQPPPDNTLCGNYDRTLFGLWLRACVCYCNPQTASRRFTAAGLIVITHTAAFAVLFYTPQLSFPSVHRRRISKQLASRTSASSIGRGQTATKPMPEPSKNFLSTALVPQHQRCSAQKLSSSHPFSWNESLFDRECLAVKPFGTATEGFSLRIFTDCKNCHGNSLAGLFPFAHFDKVSEPISDHRKMNEQLPISGWLPLVFKHLKLLEACATEPKIAPGASFGSRHHLDSIGLISGVDSKPPSADPMYIATEKGLRALQVHKIMKELGIVRQRRPLARFPDNDLVRLLVVLEEMISAHQRVLSGLWSTPRRS
jgi:hypothetical protein